MNTPYIILAAALLLTIPIGLIRITRGPTPADTMLAVLLLGTTGTGIALLLGSALNIARAIDVALVFALLAAIIGMAFVLRGYTQIDPNSTENERDP